jgi:hypothetical protein
MTDNPDNFTRAAIYAAMRAESENIDTPIAPQTLVVAPTTKNLAKEKEEAELRRMVAILADRVTKLENHARKTDNEMRNLKSRYEAAKGALREIDATLKRKVDKR